MNDVNRSKGKKDANKEKKENKNDNTNNSSGPVLQKKDRRIDDKEVQKYEELLNRKTHRPKKDFNKKK